MNLRHDYPTASPSVQLLWTLMLILICACATTILSAGLMACSGIPPEELLSFNTPRATAWLKGLQAVQSAGIFIGPVLLLMLLSGGRAAVPGLYVRVPLGKICLILAMMLCLLPAINLAAAWNEGLKLPDALSQAESWMRQKEDAAQSLTNAFLNTGTVGGFIINVVVICALAAIGEEWLFRGVLQPVFIRLFRSPAWGIVMTGLLFSAIHLQFYGFFPRWFLGILFGWIAWRTRSVWAAVWAHFVNNFAAVLTAAMIHGGRWPEHADRFGSAAGERSVALMLAVTAVLMLWFIIRQPAGRAVDTWPPDAV